tara:strand:- start:67 stop:306 length:240 start_codon:yes stop_codon:yes gene_type:complete
MKKYDNELRGAAFPNHKAFSPKSPTHIGFVEIEGRKFDLAMWEGKSSNGIEYLSIKLTPADISNYQAPEKQVFQGEGGL